ncbi:hypothetical protein LY78DRAFT_664782 [Colletotrichum sublineola]|nr:hypothetical protein LY78DRAFT_664782 [Colletotrichum sublineola]
MSKYTPDALQKAIDEVLAGSGYREAARRWGILHTILHCCLKGAKSIQEAKADY